MNIAYLDCFSGISGDMLLGALLGAGWPEEELQGLPGLLGLSGCQVVIRQKMVGALAAVAVTVEVAQSQPHRHLAEIEALLTASDLPAMVRAKAVAVFHRLAAAEAAVHGCTPQEVHFHEVGGVDALVDVVGTVLGLTYLGIDKLVCSPLPLSRGWVTCAHGALPLPAPAVCHLLQEVPVYGEELAMELVTPTGAALCRELATGFGQLPAMRLRGVGYGAGSATRPDGRPNLLRLLLGVGFTPPEAQRVEVIETHLDDWSPESWPQVAQRLLESGALDVSLQPLHMKKGRPGFCLRVICEQLQLPALQELIFSETSAIGLRLRTEQRVTLPRTILTIATEFGPIRAKKILTPHGEMLTPEYEDCCRVAREHHLPIKDVYSLVGLAAATAPDHSS